MDALRARMASGETLSSSSLHYQNYSDTAAERYQLLFNMLLRKESGVVINFWDYQQTLELVRDFCNVCVFIIFHFVNKVVLNRMIHRKHH